MNSQAQPLPILSSVSKASAAKFQNSEFEELRARAHTQLMSRGLPNYNEEAWRFFDTRPLERTNYLLANPRSPMAHANLLESLRLPEAKHSTLVVLNGELNLELSNLPEDNGLLISKFRDLDPSQQNDILQELLPSLDKSFGEDPFLLMNTALLESMTFISLEKGREIKDPIHVLYLVDESSKAPLVVAPIQEMELRATVKMEKPSIMAHPRLLVSLAEHSSLTLIEEWVSQADAPFINSITHLSLEHSSTLHHVRVQRNQPRAFHIDRLSVRLGSFSKYDSCSYAFGSWKARSDVHLQMADREAWARIDGVAILANNQEVDTHSVIENISPQVTSNQLHKIVTSDKSHGIFNGNIIVRPGAQQIKAYQLNRNLLLGERSRVDAKPQLEIFADDVECSHGSATGQLDEDQLFYLQTRGIPYQEAKATLSYAFAAEVIETIQVKSLKKRLIEETYLRIQNAS